MRREIRAHVHLGGRSSRNLDSVELAWQYDEKSRQCDDVDRHMTKNLDTSDEGAELDGHVPKNLGTGSTLDRQIRSEIRASADLDGHMCRKIWAPAQP